MNVLAPLHITCLCFALLACVPTDQPDPAKRDATAEQTQQPPTDTWMPVQDSASIAGEWDVARFEGYEPKRLSGAVRAAFADFGVRGVSLRIECNYSGRAGTVKNGRFTVSPNDVNPPQTLMGCGREREARDSRYFSFFSKNPSIERDGPSRLRLFVEGSELILERPAIRRLRSVPMLAEVQGNWRMMELTRYFAEGGYSGIGLSDAPGLIVISGDSLLYSSCPKFAVKFRLAASGKLEQLAKTSSPRAQPDCPALSQKAVGTNLPVPFDAVRVLVAEPDIEKTDEDSLLLSADRFGLLITKVR